LTKMKKILGFLLILLNLALSGYAQDILDFKPYDTQKAAITVIENGKTLKAPFAGGIDAAQFASCDLNLDGKKDIPFSLLNNQIKLESSSLVPGFYVVDIQTNQHRYSSKFIKQ